MEFEDLYEVIQTDNTPSKWQIIRKKDKVIMGTYESVGPLSESIANFRLRLLWNQLKSV